MTSGDIVQKLFVAFANNDDQAFRAAAQNYISEERRKNHHVLARELERVLARANGSAGFAAQTLGGLVHGMHRLPQDKNRAADLVEVKEAERDLEELVLAVPTHEALERIVAENRRGEVLRSHGVCPANKLLFYGPPGCGKTAAAESLAKQLYFPLVLVRFDAVISSYLGDTAANLRQVFDLARRQPMVLFFDEFDAVGKKRDDADEHGELKRVVNSFLQMLDGFSGESVVVAATNHEGMLDPALWRRFDEMVLFPRPSAREIVQVLERSLRQIKLAPGVALPEAAAQLEAAPNVAHADAERVARDAIKLALLEDRKQISQSHFQAALSRTLSRLAAVEGIS